MRNRLFATITAVFAAMSIQCTNTSMTPISGVCGDAGNIQQVPFAEQFCNLFDDAIYYVSYSNGDFGEPTLILESALHKRYRITMRVPVAISEDRQRITANGAPRIELIEIESVQSRPAGTTKISFGSMQSNFGEDKWKTVVAANGEFSTIGIKLNEDSPVDGLGDYWNRRVSRFRGETKN